MLKLKSDVIVILEQFFALVKNQFVATVKVFRSDNGVEFLNSKCNVFFKYYGMIHQISYVHTPQQNVFAKKKHKYIGAPKSHMHVYMVVQVLKRL